MSEAQAVLPTEEQAKEACAFMAVEVHAPAFFEKLAAHGIQPRNQAEADQLLQLGAVLHQGETDGQYKSAAVVAQEQENPFLSAVLGRFAPQGPTQRDVDDHIKTASQQAVEQDGLVKAAALVFNHVMSGGDVIPTQATPAAQPAT